MKKLLPSRIKKIWTYLILLIALGHFAQAQIAPKPMEQSRILLNEPKLLFIKPDQPRINVSLIKHDAFFCKMEDRLYERLNIWVKFRAGSDEIYRKMIGKE